MRVSVIALFIEIALLGGVAKAQVCSNGLPGVQTDDICCSASCGTCGGRGCGSLPGGAPNCCAGYIQEAGELCSNTGEAPCIIDSTPEPDEPCQDGILGPSGACCAASCGICGGSGCARRPGGVDSCCISAILEENQSCEDTGGAAPCVVPQDPLVCEDNADDDSFGLRKLRGYEMDEEALDAEEERRLQAANPCGVPANIRLGDTCLVVTSVDVEMKVWYRKIAGGKEIIGRTDVTNLVQEWVRRGIVNEIKRRINQLLEGAVAQTIRQAGQTLKQLVQLLLPTGGIALNMFVEQIGIDFHAKVTGDVYVWKQQYRGFGIFRTACGAGWEPATPRTWMGMVKLLTESVPFFRDPIMLTVPADLQKLVDGFKELFTETMESINDQADQFPNKIKNGISGAADFIVLDGVRVP